MDPKMPSAGAVAISCSKLWLASVAWLVSMLTRTSSSSPVALEEAVHGGGVEVVLVLGRLERLRLDQDGTGEADPVLVLDHQAQEAAEIVQFALQIGVLERLVALASAPQHIVGAAQPVGRLQRVADLHGAPGIDFRI